MLHVTVKATTTTTTTAKTTTTTMITTLPISNFYYRFQIKIFTAIFGTLALTGKNVAFEKQLFENYKNYKASRNVQNLVPHINASFTLTLIKFKISKII